MCTKGMAEILFCYNRHRLPVDVCIVVILLWTCSNELYKNIIMVSYTTYVATYNKTTKSVGKGSVSTFFIIMYYWFSLIFE